MNNKRLRKIEFLCRHVIRTLPDSTAQRRDLLLAIGLSLPVENELRNDAFAMLHHMDAFDAVQTQLALDDSQALAKNNRKGDVK
jgi:hypothetical protein